MSRRASSDPLTMTTLVLGEGCALMLLAPAEYQGGMYVGFPSVTAWGVTGLVYAVVIASIRTGRLVPFAFSLVWLSGVAGVLHQAAGAASTAGQQLDRGRVVMALFVVTLIVSAMGGLWWLAKWRHAALAEAADAETRRLAEEERERRQAREAESERRRKHELEASELRAQIDAQRRADEEAQRAAEHERQMATLRAQTETQAPTRKAATQRPQKPRKAAAEARPSAPQTPTAEQPQSAAELQRRSDVRTVTIERLRRGEKVDARQLAVDYYGVAEPTEKQRNAARAHISAWSRATTSGPSQDAAEAAAGDR